MCESSYLSADVSVPADSRTVYFCNPLPYLYPLKPFQAFLRQVSKCKELCLTTWVTGTSIGWIRQRTRHQTGAILSRRYMLLVPRVGFDVKYDMFLRIWFFRLLVQLTKCFILVICCCICPSFFLFVSVFFVLVLVFLSVGCFVRCIRFYKLNAEVLQVFMLCSTSSGMVHPVWWRSSAV